MNITNRLAAILFLLQLTLSAHSVGSYTTTVPDSAFRESRLQGYHLTNPLLECDFDRPTAELSVVKMEREMRKYIDSLNATGKLLHASVYFRDLNNGPWMGINEKEDYSPASLLKLPILIAALRYAEDAPGFLTNMMAYTSETLPDSFHQNITDPTALLRDSFYTNMTYLQNMISHSDNLSKDLLMKQIPPVYIDRVLQDFGIDINRLGKYEDWMSVKSYSSFFRILYNATYLSRQSSEMALNILTGTGFKKGLVQGVPDDITVAHKFGERGFAGSPILQLHDCGIVYKPGKPYLICVMSRGKNFQFLESVIARLSGMAYKYAGK